MHEANIFIHVLAGTIACFIGFIPFFTPKGSSLHRRSGRLFLLLLSIVIFTAFNGILFFRNRPFLTVITFLASYMGISGFRALKYKAQGPGIIDLLLVMIMGIVGFSFIYRIQTANILWSTAIVYYTLGYLAIYLIYDLLRIFKWIKSEKLWLLEHIVKMTSAFSAIFGTAVGTVFENWAPYNQFVAAGIGNVLLIFGIVFYFRKGRKMIQV